MLGSPETLIGALMSLTMPTVLPVVRPTLKTFLPIIEVSAMTLRTPRMVLTGVPAGNCRSIIEFEYLITSLVHVQLMHLLSMLILAVAQSMKYKTPLESPGIAKLP